MKVIKSLLLGSTAAVAGVAVAQAADLPSRKAAPAEYVKICDAYGAGFFYIPGTDTCLRVGGYVRAEYIWDQSGLAFTVPSFKANGFALTPSNSTIIPSGVQDQTGFLGRGRLEMDARTQSPFGTARTLIGLRAQATSGVYTNADNALAGNFTGQGGGTAITVENAIIQFAGFTFGRTTGEVFSFMPAFNYNSFANAGYPGGINLLTYTATFGGGFSGTIGIEDRAGQNYSVNPGYIGTANVGGAAPFSSVPNQAAFAGGSASGVGGAVTNGPFTWPVLAANLRVDQSWGALQVMGRVQQNAVTTNYAAAVITGGNPNVTLTQTGWAIGAGIKLNLPMLAAGDTLYATAAYANGDLDALTGFSTSASTSNAGKELNGLQRIDRDIYLTPSAINAGGACTGAVAGNLTSACWATEQTTGWSTAAWFTHYWTPTLRSVLLASYVSLTPGSRTQNTDWTVGGLSKANEFRIGGQLVWSPVKDLDIGGELSYERLNANLTGQNGAFPTCFTAAGFFNAGACANYVGISASSNVWQARLRVQRQF